MDKVRKHRKKYAKNHPERIDMHRDKTRKKRRIAFRVARRFAPALFNDINDSRQNTAAIAFLARFGIRPEVEA